METSPSIILRCSTNHSHISSISLGASEDLLGVCLSMIPCPWPILTK